MVARVPQRRQRGSVRQRGGSFEVRVYAGPDLLTGRDTYLTESTRDEANVEEITTRLLAKVDRERNASTRATLGYTIDEWLAHHDVDANTRDGYRGYIERTIKPALGDVPLAKLDVRTLERFYGQLRRCRARCKQKPFIEHRVDGPHECREVRHRRKRPHDCAEAGCRVLECAPHTCRPMAISTVRQIHWIVSGALEAAVRWEWITTSPAAVAKKGKQPIPSPDPPSAANAARLVTAAFNQDADWGMLIWLLMVTGARRGEILALRWRDLDLDTGILEIRRSFSQRSGKAREKDTKTHQIRRIGLDDMTVELLGAHRDRYTELVKPLDLEPTADTFVFSYTPAHTRPCNPDAITHRYGRMCADLGIGSRLHALRHYAATELISAGVNLRDVAGQLGHGGGGATTLRIYTAWVNQANKLNASILAGKITPPLVTGQAANA